jgi:TetR/AcrR family transcriptional repressor of nem operon
MGRQLKSYQETGQVLGCPIYALGAQISTQDQELRALILEIIHRHGSYFEEAIQEAQLLGQMEPGDAAQKARTLLFCYAGLLSQARIENNVELVRQLSPTVLATIGVGSPERTKADALSQATSA